MRACAVNILKTRVAKYQSFSNKKCDDEERESPAIKLKVLKNDL